MKPLYKSKIDSFLKRFDNFIDSEIRSLKVISASQMQITLTAQDSARGNDWVTIKFEFSDVIDAKLLPDQQLNYVDMSEGVTLIFDNDTFAFAAAACYNISSIKNAPLYIIAKNLKYKEAQF